MADVAYKTSSLTVIAAASKGTFKSMFFNGIEGNQGPYQLTGTAGQREIIVLAGTEKVYINGERQLRGEDNDYTIEYASGQIIFTRKRLITADSRITVDFEYSDQKFQKQVLGAQGGISLLRDRIHIRGNLLYESDDRENPLDIVLSDEYRAILRTAGDDPDSAVAAGALYAGQNQGSYVKKDSLGKTIYVYAGTGKGDHIVRFSYVGENQGDYTFRGYGIYQYTGDGEGDYAPQIYLPVPRAHQVAGISSDVDITSRVRISAAMALSSRDNNTYSGKDDADNTGVSWQSSLSVDRVPISLLGKSGGMFSLNARIRKADDSYVPLAREQQVEHGRKWGKDETDYSGEDVREMRASWHPADSVSLNGEWGSLMQGEAFSSSRSAIGFTINRLRLPAVQFISESISSRTHSAGNGFWRRRNGSIAMPVGFVRTSFVYQGEHKRQDLADSAAAGFKFDEYTGKVEAGKQRFLISHRETYRKNDQYDNSTDLMPESEARTGQTSMSFRPSNAFSSALLFTRRSRTYSRFDKEDMRSNLADLILRYNGPVRIISGSIQYSYSTTQASQMVRDTIQVGDGLGNYRFDEELDEIVPDQDGDLFIRTIQTGVFLPVNHLKFSTDITMRGGDFFRKKSGFAARFLSHITSQTVFRIERKDRDNDFGDVNRYAFSSSAAGDSAVVLQLLSLRHYSEYTSDESDLSLRLDCKEDYSANYELVNSGLDRKFSERSFRLKYGLNKRLGMEARGFIRSDDKNYADSRRTDRDIQVIGAELEASFRHKRRFELSFQGMYAGGIDRAPDQSIRANSLFFQTGFSYEILQKGRLRAEIEVGRISVPGNRTSVPYEMFRGDQPGTTRRWSMYFSYQMNAHVMATVSYRGRDEPWRTDVFHAGQVEVRAFF